MTEHLDHVVVKAADIGSIGIAAGALLSWLPEISAGLSIVWMLLRIYQAATGKHLFGKRDRD